MKSVAIIYSVIIACISLSCNKYQVAVPELSAGDMSLLQTHQAWLAAIREGNVTKMLSYWDENAVDYFPGKPAVTGKKAIKQLVKKNRRTPGFALTSEVQEAHVAESGEMGYTTGSFNVTSHSATGSEITKAGQFICVWRKTSGVWKCVRSMSTLEHDINTEDI